MRKFVIGRIKLKPGMRDEFLRVGKTYMETSRADPGCIYYSQGLDHDDPDGLIVVECWETPELHAAHTQAAHFAAFGPVFMKYLVSAHFEEMDVGEVHDVVIGG